MSAWSNLKKDLRDGRRGWSKSGEFFCYNCDFSVGRNLKGELPTEIARKHLLSCLSKGKNV